MSSVFITRHGDYGRKVETRAEGAWMEAETNESQYAPFCFR